MKRTVPLTDMPLWLMLVLLAIAQPRTILEDLNVVAPESSLLYYILALTPFVAWFAVALVRPSRQPFMDFVVLGILYGLSLALVHQALWDVGSSLGAHPPAGAVSFASGVAPSLRELALRGYTVVIAMMIGVGSGLVVGLAALVARAGRSRLGRTSRGAGSG